ncbi:MAG: hypothetical protein HXX08_11215 [Chloroflexi bacterium]|uniref:Uncharacterized protein n=1 Tax=Candidatus Chlorohelix allophototropha TaxID=3003348 RepID=A0A8T7LWR7_9CHLR|nr:hypothetical protein [Chloroflexota bacterium]WJW65806.1 hypothetical protein OZ401_001585 [Chloroflexota bacterium L227-S17]
MNRRKFIGWLAVVPAIPAISRLPEMPAKIPAPPLPDPIDETILLDNATAFYQTASKVASSIGDMASGLEALKQYKAVPLEQMQAFSRDMQALFTTLNKPIEE